MIETTKSAGLTQKDDSGSFAPGTREKMAQGMQVDAKQVAN
jgi:hypothetical protein